MLDPLFGVYVHFDHNYISFSEDFWCLPKCFMVVELRFCLQCRQGLLENVFKSSFSVSVSAVAQRIATTTTNAFYSHVILTAHIFEGNLTGLSLTLYAQQDDFQLYFCVDFLFYTHAGKITSVNGQ